MQNRPRIALQPRQLSFVAILLLACMAFPKSLAGVPQKNSGAFQALSEQAAKASRENRLDDAAILYRKALALRPRWAEGWWSLGTLQYDRNRYPEAARAFEKVIALKPENGTAHAMLGLCQVELKQDDAALKNLTLAQHQGVQNNSQLQHVVLFQLSGVQLRKRRFGDAATNLTLLVKDGVRSDDVATSLGMAALLIPPQSAPAKGTPGHDVIERVGRAQILATQKDFDTARQLFSLIAGEYPAYPNLHYAFGRFLLDLHEPDQAVAQFQQELKNDPRHVGALLEIAAVRYRVDSPDGVKFAEQAVKISPQLPFAHFLLGLLYLDTDQPAKAVPELEIGRKAFPKEPQTYFALGNAYSRIGKKEEAARMRSEFVRLNAQKSEVTAPTVYGEQPSGVLPSPMLDDKLRQQSSPPPN